MSSMARVVRRVLVLALVVAVAVTLVSADGWFGQKSEDKAKETVEAAKTWPDWASSKLSYFSSSAAEKSKEELDASTQAAADVASEGRNTASDVAGEGQKSAGSAASTAKHYATKGLERVRSTKDQIYGTTAGYTQRWSRWAKDNLGKYYSFGPLSKKAADLSSNAASDLNSAAENLESAKDGAAETVQSGAEKTKETVDAAKDEVVKTADEKEL